jgi:hypothetical protein
MLQLLLFMKKCECQQQIVQANCLSLTNCKYSGIGNELQRKMQLGVRGRRCWYYHNSSEFHNSKRYTD